MVVNVIKVGGLRQKVGGELASEFDSRFVGIEATVVSQSKPCVLQYPVNRTLFCGILV